MIISPAHLRGNAGHAGSAKAIEDDIAGFGVVENVAHNGFVGNFGMVAVGVINGVVLTFGDICGEGFALVIVGGWVVGGGVFADKIFNKGIGASGVVRRVGERDNIFVGAFREAFDIADFV